MHTQRPTVLFAEDEFLLRALLEEPLDAAGYNVITALTGEDAIKKIDDHGAEIGALITDVNLGGPMDGWKLAQYARERLLGLPVIYATSYGVEEWMARGVVDSVHIRKPFLAAQVVSALSKLLDK